MNLYVNLWAEELDIDTASGHGPTCHVGCSYGVVSLHLIKLRRHRDDGFVNGDTQVLLSHLPHLQQQLGSDELWTDGESLIGGDEKLCTSIVIRHLKDQSGQQ